jgi:hypothetical protein
MIREFFARRRERLDARAQVVRALLDERYVVSIAINDGLPEARVIRQVVGPLGRPDDYDSRVPMPWYPADYRARRRSEEAVTIGVWEGDTLIPARRVVDVRIEKMQQVTSVDPRRI